MLLSVQLLSMQGSLAVSCLPRDPKVLPAAQQIREHYLLWEMWHATCTHHMGQLLHLGLPMSFWTCCLHCHVGLCL
jgi:hypothetical protein